MQVLAKRCGFAPPCGVLRGKSVQDLDQYPEVRNPAQLPLHATDVSGHGRGRRNAQSGGAGEILHVAHGLQLHPVPMQRAGGAAAGLRALQQQVFATQAKRGARFSLRHAWLVRDVPGLQQLAHRARFDVSDLPRHLIAQSGHSVLQVAVQPFRGGKARGEPFQARNGDLSITQPAGGVECRVKQCVQAIRVSSHGRGEEGFQRKQST
jgi:hypothetical protein